MIQFLLNERFISTSVAPGMLLLDFIRYQQHLMGTKIGCREGDCGACTILIGEILGGELIYRSATSCLMPLGNAVNKHIVTVEGVNVSGLNFIQQAFADEGASQCGFCTPGFIVSVAGFCLGKAAGYQEGIDAVNGNICRCTGYKSIERSIAQVAEKLAHRNGQDPITFAVEHNILPSYFNTIKERLLRLSETTNGRLPTEEKPTSFFLGGGTDLYVQQQETLVEADINFLLNAQLLKGISRQGNECILGASVTVSEMLESPVFLENFPALRKYIRLVSSTQIRNMATVAGNFINASPIGDLTIFFLALDATLTLFDGLTRRKVALRKFYKGYKSMDKQPAEFIEKVSFQIPPATFKFNFEKVSKRTTLDIASVNSAILLEMEGNTIKMAGLSAGGVGPVPAYLAASAAFCGGKVPSPEMLRELLVIVDAEISPITDARGSVMYKRILLAQLIKAHFITLFPALDVKSVLHA